MYDVSHRAGPLVFRDMDSGEPQSCMTLLRRYSLYIELLSLKWLGRDRVVLRFVGAILVSWRVYLSSSPVSLQGQPIRTYHPSPPRLSPDCRGTSNYLFALLWRVPSGVSCFA